MPAAASLLTALSSGTVMPTRPRVLIVGGGPVGLEAAVSCSLSGFAVTVCEKGASIGAAVRDWGHVQLFSANKINCSPDGLRALSELGCPAPDSELCPTGNEYCTAYLDPLTRWLEQREECEVLLGAAVESISRGRLLKGDAIKAVGAKARDSASFAALVDISGEERMLDGLAAVVDCSGTYGNGNFLGCGGAPAVGERKLRMQRPDDFFYDRLPDVMGTDQEAFSPRAGSADGAKPTVNVALIGGGYSAATTLRGLIAHATQHAASMSLEIDWLLRKPAANGAPYASIADDPLPSRASLVEFANSLAASTAGANGPAVVRVHRGVSISTVGRDPTTGGLVVSGTREGGVAGAEEEAFEFHPRALVAHCGFRPSYDLASELQVHLCYASEGPMKLASSLLAAKVAAESSGDASAAGDCLKQAAPGPELLTTPEPNFYVLGAKSYGRSSAFLLMLGHKQVQAVVGLLTDALMPSADLAADGPAAPVVGVN